VPTFKTWAMSGIFFRSNGSPRVLHSAGIRVVLVSGTSKVGSVLRGLLKGIKIKDLAVADDAPFLVMQLGDGVSATQSWNSNSASSRQRSRFCE